MAQCGYSKAGGETCPCSLAETVSRFLSGRGHHFPVPSWEGCRATLYFLMSRSALPAGGCRLSGWRWCFWLLRSWRWCFLLACGFVFLWAPTQRPVFFRRYPFDVLGLWLPATEASRVGGPLVVSVMTDQMVGDRRSPGATMLGVEVVCFLRQPSLPGPLTGPEPSDASWCGRCTSWQVDYIQTGSFSRACSGTSVRSTRGVAASFLACCRGSRNFVQVAAATSALCRGRSQQNITFQMFLQLQTLRRHVSRPVAAVDSLSFPPILLSFFHALGLLTTCTSEVCLCTLWLASFSTMGLSLEHG